MNTYAWAKMWIDVLDDHKLGKSLSYGHLSLKAKVLWPMLLDVTIEEPS